MKQMPTPLGYECSLGTNKTRYSTTVSPVYTDLPIPDSLKVVACFAERERLWTTPIPEVDRVTCRKD